MNSVLKVVNWIGIFGLVIGCLISIFKGSFISATIGAFLVSILTSSSLLSNYPKVSSKIPKYEKFEVGVRGGGVGGCWLLTLMGGIQFLGGSIILTLSLLGSMWMRFRSSARRPQINNQIQPSSISVKDAPSYTVEIVSEDSKPESAKGADSAASIDHFQYQNNLRIQTPIMNV